MLHYHRSMSEMSAEYAVWLKANVCDAVAGGRTVTDACDLFRADPRVIWRWRKQDREFDAQLTECEELLYTRLADSLVNIHLEAGDAKMASVLVKARVTVLGWYKPEKYGSKPRSAEDLNAAG